MVVRVGAQPLPGLGDRDQPGDDEILAELPVAFQGPMAGPWAVRSITAGSAPVVSYSDGVRTAAREYGDEGGYLPAEYIHRPDRVTPAKNLITTRSQKMRRAMPGTPGIIAGLVGGSPLVQVNAVVMVQDSSWLGFIQRSPLNRAKSPSNEQMPVPCSMASAARWASVTRLPRALLSTRSRPMMFR